MSAELLIRPLCASDSADVHEMRAMEGVRENIPSTSSERLEVSEAKYASLTADDHILVAEAESGGGRKVVGWAWLRVNANPRRRHSALFGIMVRTDWQRRGVGRRLMDELFDLADNWLLLKRVELEVFADHEHAIRLYESYGFEVEGRLRASTVKNGAYADCLVMARLR